MSEKKCYLGSLFEKISGKAESRCTKFLDVAYRLFLDNGYENVSMNDIVKHAGGSLTTLYKHFGNKEQLLIYVLEQKTEELFGEWERRSHCYEGRIEEFLMQTGKLFLDLIITDDAVLFHRLIVSVGYMNDAKLGEEIMKSIMARPTNIIAEYLENEKAKGHIELDDATLCAQQFLNALEEPFMFPRILGVETDISEEKQTKALNQIVKIFCRGLRVS